MKQYLDAASQILREGSKVADRTGTGTISDFGRIMMIFDLQAGFPALTTKRIPIKSIIVELLWFLNGQTDLKTLKDQNCGFWDNWATEDGETGAPYGRAWRSWPTSDGRVIDQITEVIHNLKTKPMSRRHLVSAWNPERLPDESKSPQQNVLEGRDSLAACHAMFQFKPRPLKDDERYKLIPLDRFETYRHMTHVQGMSLTDAMDELGIKKYALDCLLFQRSADWGCGVPSNIASYSLLTMMVAQCVNMVPGRFTWTGGDCHIYTNHLSFEDPNTGATVGIFEQLKHTPGVLPKMLINPEKTDIFSFVPEDFKLIDYYPQMSFKYPVST